MYQRQCRRRKEDAPVEAAYKASKFGEVVTADHAHSADEEGWSVRDDRYLLVVKDVYSGWLEAYPVHSNDADDAFNALNSFLGQNEKIGFLHRWCARV